MIWTVYPRTHGDSWDRYRIGMELWGIPPCSQGLLQRSAGLELLTRNAPVLYGDYGTYGASPKLISAYPRVCRDNRSIEIHSPMRNGIALHTRGQPRCGIDIIIWSLRRIAPRIRGKRLEGVLGVFRCSGQVLTNVLAHGGGGLRCLGSDCNFLLRECYAGVRFVGVQWVATTKLRSLIRVLELDDVWSTDLPQYCRIVQVGCSNVDYVLESDCARFSRGSAGDNCVAVFCRVVWAIEVCASVDTLSPMKRCGRA